MGARETGIGWWQWTGSEVVFDGKEWEDISPCIAFAR